MRSPRRFFCAEPICRFVLHGAVAMNHKSLLAGILLLLTCTLLPCTASAAVTSPAEDSLHSFVRTPEDRASAARLQAQRFSGCTPICPVNPKQSLSFQDMWALIVKHQRARSSHFSPELLACLFWEESGYRLIEHPISHASGYGQVLPANLDSINKRYGTNFTKQDLLTSPDASTEAAILMLEMAWDWKHDKVQALYVYAGAGGNRSVVHKWLAAETKLREANSPFVAALSMDWLLRNHKINAMRLCSQPGFDPQTIFD